jgi:cyclic pyranopterin phosphate synthase
MSRLIDPHGRHIDYLRISITDHCNLKCTYCTPFSGRDLLPRAEVLSYEEIWNVTKAAVMAGISKIRITGGEPLVRKGMVGFCRMLSNIDGLKSLTLTTNGIFLEEFAEPLFEAGIRRINVSLDTLKPDRFKKITGRDLFYRVLSGIDRAEEVGMYPIKINTVVMRGINDDEIEDLAKLTLNKPYHVRFIELMPTDGWASGDYDFHFVPIEEVMKKVTRIGEVQIQPAIDSWGPVRLCILPEAKGKVGFIAPLSWHFCGTCNRLRLTADGKLRACLFSKEETDVKGPLRTGASLTDLVVIFKQAVTSKPQGHMLNETDEQQAFGRAMCAIGG